MFFDHIVSNDGVAIIEGHNQYTYSDVIKFSKEIVEDIGSREFVFLLCDNSALSIISYVGLIRKRVVVVLLESNIRIDTYMSLLNKYKPNYTIATKKLHIELSCRVIHGVYIYDNYPMFKHNIHNDLCILLSTSGSTGSSKFVKLSYENIYNNTVDIISYLNIKNTHTTITTLPMSYTYGLSIINTHLFIGGQIIVNKVSVISNNFINILSEHKVDSFGGVPFTYELLSRNNFLSSKISSLKYMTQAGGKLANELLTKFIDYCKSNEIQFIKMYGQTEATARISYLPWASIQYKSESIGIPIPNGSIKLKISDRTIVNPNTVGEIVYYGKNVMMGYSNDYEDLKYGHSLNGELYTGDLAYKDEDGYYYITGRKKRIIKLFGKRINLDDVEKILSSIGLTCACIEDNDELIIYHEQSYDTDIIKRHLYSHTDIKLAKIRVVKLNQLPRTFSGKIDYESLLDKK